jgi:hypothetical protein
VGLKEGNAKPLTSLTSLTLTPRVCADSWRRAGALLQAFEEQGRTVSPNPSNSYAPMIFAREADADDVSKAAILRAMPKLLRADRINIDISGPPSKQREKLTLGHAPTKTREHEVQKEDANG